jgi:hypothetical protein
MALSLREECWIKCCVWFITVILLDNCYIQLYCPFSMKDSVEMFNISVCACLWAGRLGIIWETQIVYRIFIGKLAQNMVQWRF